MPTEKITEQIDNSKMVDGAKFIAGCNEAECFRIMSYLQIRLEYLHGLEHLERCGYVPS